MSIANTNYDFIQSAKNCIFDTLEKAQSKMTLSGFYDCDINHAINGRTTITTQIDGKMVTVTFEPLSYQ